MEKEPIKSHEDLKVYKMAFDLAMKIFELFKKFPIEERYSLTDPPGSAVAHGGNPLQPFGHPAAGVSLSRVGEDRAASPNS
jgi:hypothetical protein